MWKKSEDAFFMIEMLGHHVSWFATQEEYFNYCSEWGKKVAQVLKGQEESDSAARKSIQTLLISNETIETGMEMCTLHDRMDKAVNISKAWNETDPMTTMRDVHPPTHPAFVIGLVTQDRHHCVTEESLASKLMKSAADTIKFTM